MIAHRLFPAVFGIVLAVMSSSATSRPTLRDVAWWAGDTTPNVENSEPSIAVNPLHSNEIAIVAFSGSWKGSSVGATVWKSWDGGGHWRRVQQIFAPRSGAIGPLDQDVAFDRNGNLYVVAVALDASLKNHQAYIYHPGGRVDGPMVAGEPYPSGNNVYADEPLLAIDRSSRSWCVGNMYSPFVDQYHQSHVATSIPPNFGATVHDHPLQVPLRDTHLEMRSTRVAVAPEGRVYVVFNTLEGEGSDSNFEYTHFTVQRSDRCGAQWSAIGYSGNGVSVTTKRAQTYNTENFGAAKMPNVAQSSNDWIAVAPDSGEVYVSYVKKDASGYAQIYVAHSDSHGARWTTTGPITDGAHDSGFPEIAAASSGDVGVLYVDYDPSGPGITYRHHLARSFDHGAHWRDEILQSMDVTTLNNATPRFIWGDYEGLTTVGSQYYGVFTGASMCRPRFGMLPICRPKPQLDPIFFTETVKPPTWVRLYGPNIGNLCQFVMACTIPGGYINQGDPCGFCGVVVFGGEIFGASVENGMVRTLFVSRGSSIGLVGAADAANLSVVETVPGAGQLKSVSIKRTRTRGHLVGLALTRNGRFSGMLYTGRIIPLRLAAKAGFTRN